MPEQGAGVSDDLPRTEHSAARRIPHELWRVVQRKLKTLDVAARLEDLTVPAGNRLVPLKGCQSGRYKARGHWSGGRRPSPWHLTKPSQRDRARQAWHHCRYRLASRASLEDVRSVLDATASRLGSASGNPARSAEGVMIAEPARIIRSGCRRGPTTGFVFRQARLPFHCEIGLLQP